MMTAEGDAVKASWETPSWLGLASVTIAASLFLGQAMVDGGWLEAFFGRLAVLFWAGEAVWLVVTILAVRKRRAWWALLASPLALYPLVMAGALLAACSQGNCL